MTNEIDFNEIAKIVAMFVCGFVAIVLGIVFIQKRTLEIIIEANGADAEKSKKAKVFCWMKDFYLPLHLQLLNVIDKQLKWLNL